MMDFRGIEQLVANFLPAVVITIFLSAISAGIGMISGFALNALREFSTDRVRQIIQAYIWLIRGTPFLVQIFVIYFGLPSVGITLSAIQSSILSLSLYATAYFCEIYRGAWNSIPVGQAEAARSLGISRRQIFLNIQAPQAIAFSIPMLANQAILTLKESAITSVITVPELTMTAERIVSESFNYLGPYLIIALTYWFLATAISMAGRAAENNLSRRLYGCGKAVT